MQNIILAKPIIIPHDIPYISLKCYNKHHTYKQHLLFNIICILGGSILKQKRCCSNCMFGTAIAVNKDILCREKGAVSPDYACSRHKFTPQPKNPRELDYKCIDCENFILKISDSESTTTIGLCQLFSVRQYDGRQKNPCSKFVKRKELEVS